MKPRGFGSSLDSAISNGSSNACERSNVSLGACKEVKVKVKRQGNNVSPRIRKFVPILPSEGGKKCVLRGGWEGKGWLRAGDG